MYSSPAPRYRCRPISYSVGLLVLLASLLGPASAFAACTGASALPTSASAAEGATLCLVNDERRSHGLAGLRENGELSAASARHARDMAERGYFGHTSPDGRSFTDRIKAAGYVRGAENYSVGENLGWGSGETAAPDAIVAAWMASPGHRANILSPRFKEIGFGMASGGQGGRTLYATDFGTTR